MSFDKFNNSMDLVYLLTKNTIIVFLHETNLKYPLWISCLHLKLVVK